MRCGWAASSALANRHYHRVRRRLRYGPPMTRSREEFIAALPRKVAAAGALVTDGQGRVLIVKPTYKAGWEIPGGCVEVVESAPAACAREVREELGLTLKVGRLLVVEHEVTLEGDAIKFVYDCGNVASTDRMTLAADEIQEVAFVEPDELDAHLPLQQARRLAAAVHAVEQVALIELVNGEVVGPPSPA